MGFLKGLFGTKAEPPKRQLNHPRQLQVGDMITLDTDFGLPAQLRGQQFRVEAVNTYEYSRSQHPEWVLKGYSGDTVFLGLEEDDECSLVFSITITRPEVDSLFGLDAFSEIFEEEQKAELQTLAVPERLEQWVGKQYHEVSFAEFGYFHRQDYRGLKPPQDANGACGDAFEAYGLEDDSGERALEVEVYEGGDTEVCVSLYRPLSDIREYWPGS
ncbi:hypothetical protein JYB88_03635 [Shewanella cyperi]|uniref:DUF4178 domain-containing protein n=1 Tax=Shewanella cyperi TaxID=2814292 RepID=A0A975AL27_9GAMM|nr:hypothetical protein [Shewanella cyperi]QSX30765.1 hypothetical protein JYB88_03635 [Shewanella cyperi]